MGLTDNALREFSRQANDRMAAFIEVQGMIAENQQREVNGESMAYTKDHFDKVMELYSLGYNDNIDKIRNFY